MFVLDQASRGLLVEKRHPGSFDARYAAPGCLVSAATIEVYRYAWHELPAEDPDGRMTFIGVGAAVFNLRVAAASLGSRTSTVALPDGTRCWPPR
ncbi:hypothetical protein GCM10023317_27950 [Actinopolymorpha pittospori]|uniref:Uncharacterized protein n=1 Tax=Actinopolymorpha pittospori TaxID=648752 RepID=A0A927MNN2_9ACTN|nr:hypothetical protein [Actinopolymorpha pittospori]